MSIPATLLSVIMLWRSAFSNTKRPPRRPVGPEPAMSTDPNPAAQRRLLSWPLRVRPAYATTSPDRFQAPNFIDVNDNLPNFIDNSIRSPSWPTGTAIRKCPSSPAARQRKTWPSLLHCAACGDTPASAIRARSIRRAIIVPVIMRIGPQGGAVASIPLAELSGSMSAPMLAATRAADSCTESRARWA